jgi:hypothetical protein
MSSGFGSNVLKTDDNKEIALHIASLLQEIRFGSIEVVIHDGRIVQIDKRERFRVNEQKNGS